MVDHSECDLFPQKFKSNQLNIGIVFPDSYFIGMSSLAFQALRNSLIKIKAGNIFRFFFENDKLISPESNSFSNIDLFFITCSFENNYLNLESICAILKKKPSIIGGLCPTYNPIYFKSNFNIIYRGDLIEEELKQSITDVIKNKSYITNYHKSKSMIPHHSSIIAKNTEFSNSFLIEIMKGCLSNCSFCLVSSLNKPVKTFSSENIITILEQFTNTYHKIGLIAPTINDHPDILTILNWCIKNKKTIGFSSVRLDKANEQFLKLYAQSGQKSLTFAPETFSKIQMKNLNKVIDREKYLNKIKMLLDMNIINYKIYLLCGLPKESLSDIDENINFLKKIKNLQKEYAKKHKKIGTIKISVNPLIPKPFTKFSDCEFIKKNDYKRTIAYMKKKLIPLGNISLKSESYSHAFQQYMLSTIKEN